MADSNTPPDSQPALTRSAVEEVMQGAEQLGIAELARARSEDMLGVLVDAAESNVKTDDEGKPLEEAPSWAVRTNAARTVIEIGHGRAATQQPDKDDGSIYITVNKLFMPGSTEKTIHSGKIEAEIAKTFEVQGARVNLVEDLVEIVPVLGKPPENEGGDP